MVWRIKQKYNSSRERRMALEDKQGYDNILGGVFSNLSDAGAFRIS
jgi:hypothetical protein